MTDLSVLSAKEAIQFLEWLDPVGLHNLVALDPLGVEAPDAITVRFGERGQIQAESFISAHNGNRNLYFSINEPSGAARCTSKLRRDEIGAVRAFHVDIDKLEGAPDWDFDCLPSAVIDSGGGKWGFWKLAEKKPVISADIAEIEAQNRALTAYFHGDAQAHNLDRIARLPGTVNIPNAAKRKKGRVPALARVVSLGGPLWEPAEVAAWCPPLAVHNKDVVNKAEVDNLGVEPDRIESVTQAAVYLTTAPASIEGDNGDLMAFEVAAQLKNFGVSQDTAARLMADIWNPRCEPPWEFHDLRQKVRNGYAYATGAFGRDSEVLAETEFEPVEIEQPKSPAKRTMAAVPFTDIAEDFSGDPTFLIEGWYELDTMIVTYGESNSGKTHVVLDQALAIAAGRPWAGRKTHKGLVVYVAAEGGPGVRRRVMAHKVFRPEYKDLPFALVPYPINLMHANADAKALIALVKAEEARTGQKCAMVVVDTLSRALAGGDENSSADMGAFVKRCDEIRAATGAALHVIHHAGKNTAKGARGHSLLRAAVDTEIEIENNTVMCRKQRDMEGARELRFDYKPVAIGCRADGTEVLSVVLDAWEASEFDVEFTPQMQNVFDTIETLVTRKIQKVGAENAAPETSMFAAKEVLSEGIPHATVERALRELTETGVLAKCKRGLYKINRTPKPSRSPQT